MNGQHQPDGRHPDAAALAEYQAGLAGGRRGRRLAAHVANCARCTSVSDQLAAVTSALASAPVPPLPDAVEGRITAALAAEASLTAETATADEPRHTAPRRLHNLRPSQRTRGNTGPRQSRGDASGPPRRARGGRRPRPAVLLSGAAAACLVLFGAVFGLVHLTSGPSSPSAASGSQSSPVSGPEVAGPAAGGMAGGHVAGSAEKATFAVTASGTRYEPATLAAQVNNQIAAKSAKTPSPASARLATSSPSPQLAGCVLHLTSQARPSLVDLATYQGKPAYVIAVPDRVWVVGPDCTASDPHLITSIGL